jgi:hypothetical protein
LDFLELAGKVNHGLLDNNPFSLLMYVDFPSNKPPFMEDFPAMFEDTRLFFGGPIFGVKLGIVFESF